MLLNVVVSLIYDGSCFTIGCSQWSTNFEIFSVMLFCGRDYGSYICLLGFYVFSLRNIIGLFCGSLGVCRKWSFATALVPICLYFQKINLFLFCEACCV